MLAAYRRSRSERPQVYPVMSHCRLPFRTQNLFVQVGASSVEISLFPFGFRLSGFYFLISPFTARTHTRTNTHTH